MQLVSKSKCANCSTDRSRDLIGICKECFQAWEKGAIVKYKDTLDKDQWSCGCGYYSYGPDYCPQHSDANPPSNH